MERDIRASRRELEAINAIGGDTKELEARIRSQIKNYHDFSKAMHIRPKDNRHRVIAGTSDLSKTNAFKQKR